MALASVASMQTPPTARTVILCAIDDSDAAAEVVQSASRQTAAAARGELHLVHCLELPLDGAQTATEALESGRGVLERVSREASGPAPFLHLAAGTPWLEIVQLAVNLHADLIVVGSRGNTGLMKLLVGSVADEVIKKASCPVLVVRPRHHDELVVPEIEPPCQACLSAQRDSQGATLWCERHSSRHARGRLHYEFPESFAKGTMFIESDA